MSKGDSLVTLSTELTSNPAQGDVPYGTLTTMSESPFRFGLIYVGTDDGMIHISKDGGYTFTLLKECSKLSKMYNVSIINNSGIPSTNTNIFKAFAAGSHSLLIENDSTFNYEISDILKLIKHGLMSLNVLNIQQLHSSNIEYTKS